MSESKNTVLWQGQKITWQDVVDVARHHFVLQLSESVWQRIHQSRDIVQQIVTSQTRAYGITTGLGALSDVVLDSDKLSQLSHNTIQSHACGVGEPLTDEQTRAIICAAIANYSHGHSGISADVVKALLALLNQQITPIVPSQGSVGYLTHMAHISLALIGMGEVHYQNQTMSAKQALQLAGLKPVTLGAKEGLSLVNGTPCMTGLASLALTDASMLLDWADIIGAMSFESLKGQLDCLDEQMLALKPSPGIQTVGKRIRECLKDSQILSQCQGIRTQDALSIRSMPQVHGACRDQFEHCEKQINCELNSATDNPLILGSVQQWRVISQAHPHGESVAMATDLLAIALAEIGSMSERRLDRLLNPLVSQLPAFLVAEPGVNSGMMIAQYTAASLCADNKAAAQPAVLDNYVTSALQEDHLSFGTRSALKLHSVVANTRHILAIEYILAAQAVEFIGSELMGSGTFVAWQHLREKVSSWQSDRWLAPDIDSATSLLNYPPMM
ncbi:histidine ammonia-lyase [Celerinatantimonas sp. MCCC 1A17872]|uniref:histidine ammonia-lyase n=1 Tax=Celerinatantimonas sp. MCCC 1A17872 TaxID=3177514 RepID=UPI0038C82437